MLGSARGRWCNSTGLLTRGANMRPTQSPSSSQPIANLGAIFSAWPRMKIDNPHDHRIAWMQDGTEDRVPEDAVECPGNCETCGICFRLRKLHRDVVFHKH